MQGHWQFIRKGTKEKMREKEDRPKKLSLPLQHPMWVQGLVEFLNQQEIIIGQNVGKDDNQPTFNVQYNRQDEIPRVTVQ